MRPLILLLLLSPRVTRAQSGSSVDIGDSAVYNFDTFSESKQSIGTTDFYRLSDGRKTMRSRVVELSDHLFPRTSDPCTSWRTPPNLNSTKQLQEFKLSQSQCLFAISGNICLVFWNVNNCNRNVLVQ